jgi:hypothetical protein
MIKIYKEYPGKGFMLRNSALYLWKDIFWVGSGCTWIKNIL